MPPRAILRRGTKLALMAPRFGPQTVPFSFAVWKNTNINQTRKSTIWWQNVCEILYFTSSHVGLTNLFSITRATLARVMGLVPQVFTDAGFAGWQVTATYVPLAHHSTPLEKWGGPSSFTWAAENWHFVQSRSAKCSCEEAGQGGERFGHPWTFNGEHHHRGLYTTKEYCLALVWPHIWLVLIQPFISIWETKKWCIFREMIRKPRPKIKPVCLHHCQGQPPGPKFSWLGLFWLILPSPFGLREKISFDKWWKVWWLLWTCKKYIKCSRRFRIFFCKGIEIYVTNWEICSHLIRPNSCQILLPFPICFPCAQRQLR